MKLNFVKLQLLTSLWPDDADWVENVRSSVGEDGYALTQDEEGEAEEQEFSCDELEFVEDGSVRLYNFMGGPGEAERFYNRDDVVFKDKAAGNYWVLYTDDVFDV